MFSSSSFSQIFKRCQVFRGVRQNSTQATKSSFVSQHFDRENLWRMDMIQSWLTSWPTANKIGLIELDRTVFGAPKRIDLLHRVVVWQQNMMKSGLSVTKTRSDVRGSTRKMRRQKGTGSARIGSRQAPSMMQGGKAHGPVLHNPTTLIQHKVVDHGKRIALSAKFAQDQLLIVDSLSMDTNKTTSILDILEKHDLMESSTLLVYGNPEPETNLILASNNLKHVLTLGAMELDVLNLLKYENVVLDLAAVKSLEQQLSQLNEYR